MRTREPSIKTDKKETIESDHKSSPPSIPVSERFKSSRYHHIYRMTILNACRSKMVYLSFYRRGME
jgi:hypothetical protein